MSSRSDVPDVSSPGVMTPGDPVPPRLEVRGVTKAYGAVQAVAAASLDVHRGEILGLIGENGAGKSTLLGVLSGTVRPDSGEIVIDGEARESMTLRAARAAGVAMVSQELTLCPNLSATENLFLGRPPRRWRSVLDRRAMRRDGCRLLEETGFSAEPNTPLGELPLAEQQLVEIGRAVSEDANILILDEPTASLSRQDFERLEGIIRRLAAKGTAVIFVSHRLEEIFTLCDRITVMRDGVTVATAGREDITAEELARLMAGEAGASPAARGGGAHVDFEDGQDQPAGRAVLEARGATRRGAFADVDFDVRQGEVVGFAGVRGSGRRELLDCVYGLQRLSGGTISLNGTEFSARSPAQARRTGIGYLPEERKTEAIIPTWDVQHNLAMGNLPIIARWGVLTRRRLTRWATRIIAENDIRPPTPERLATQLSGGNQQRMALSRVVATNPDVLLLLEPTRGVDVRAKVEIRKMVARLARTERTAVVLVESDVGELLAMADRVLVFHRGQIMGELTGDAMNEAQIALLSHGHASADGAAAARGSDMTTNREMDS